MAEEKVDGLEGLDDFDDDFGEQLDSFMENEGEEESDSELDSFFEDLSTIDDLEGDDDPEKESKKTEKITKEAKKEDNKEDIPENKTSKKDEIEDVFDQNDHENYDDNLNKEVKKKKFPLKAVIFSCITGSLLGVLTIVLMYFFEDTPAKIIPAVVIKKPIQQVQVDKIIKKKPKPKKVKIKKKLSKPKTKKLSYNIQVASCISNECLDESRVILNSLGYKPNIRTLIEKSGIAEVVSSNILNEEESVKIVRKINNNNPLAGYAFSKSTKNGYQISLGYFPDLETANRVRTYLNQAFKEDVFFEIKRTSQKINFQVIEVSGLKSKKDAELLLNTLKDKNPNFESAFLKSVTRS